MCVIVSVLVGRPRGHLEAPLAPQHPEQQSLAGQWTLVGPGSVPASWVSLGNGFAFLSLRFVTWQGGW